MKKKTTALAEINDLVVYNIQHIGGIGLLNALMVILSFDSTPENKTSALGTKQSSFIGNKYTTTSNTNIECFYK